MLLRWGVLLAIVLLSCADVHAQAPAPQESDEVSDVASPEGSEGDSVEDSSDETVGAPEPASAEESVPTQAETRKRCFAAHEEAQVHRLEGRLAQAATSLRVCSGFACPGAIRNDCLDWSSEVRREVPTIVVEVLTDDGDAANGQVFVGETLLTDSLDGRPLSVDPGPSELRVQLPDGREKTLSVVLRQGEKNRMIRIDFRSAPAPKTEASAVPTETSEHRGVPAATWILGGTAVVALGVGIGFGADSISKRNAAEESCAPLCSGSVTDEVNRSALIADVSFLVAGASAVTAGLFYIFRPGRSSSQEKSPEIGADRSAFTVRTVSALPLPGGGWVSVAGAF